MADTPDLSRIVGLIMENPDLISKIQGLARSDSSEGDDESKVKETVAEESVQTAKSSATTTDEKQRRARLLHAMKPYLSSERARAIDSMLSMAEIIDMMKQR